MNRLQSFTLFFNYVTMLVLCFLLVSCTTMTPANYTKHYEKNRSRFSRAIDRNGVVAKVAYIPDEYYAARDMEADEKLSLTEALNRYEPSLYFVLQLQAEGEPNKSVLLQNSDMDSYRAGVLKNTFERKQDIFLLNGTDTVSVSQYHYDRNWGIGNGDSFMMVFQKSLVQKDLKRYHLILRNFVPAIGTIDIPLTSLIKNTCRLKG